MFKKFWDFIKRIFGTKMQALPEGAFDCENELSGSVYNAGNTSDSKFLENNDELILTIHTNENDEKNVNIQILRNGEKINTEDNVFDKEKVVDYLKNVKIEEDEIEEIKEFNEIEDINEKNSKVYESKVIEEALNFESEQLDIDEKISELIDFEEEKIVIAEPEEVAEKINEASSAEVVASNIIEFPKNNIITEDGKNDNIDENFNATINYIRLIGFSDEEIKDLISKKPELSKIDSDIIVDNLNYLTNAGLKSNHLYEMIKTIPALLTDNKVREIDEKIELFKKKKIESSDIYSLYIKNPEIILLETKQLEQSIKIIKKFYRTQERIQYIMKYFPHVIGMTNLDSIRKCVEKI